MAHPITTKAPAIKLKIRMFFLLRIAAILLGYFVSILKFQIKFKFISNNWKRKVFLSLNLAPWGFGVLGFWGLKLGFEIGV